MARGWGVSEIEVNGASPNKEKKGGAGQTKLIDLHTRYTIHQNLIQIKQHALHGSSPSSSGPGETISRDKEQTTVREGAWRHHVGNEAGNWQ